MIRKENYSLPIFFAYICIALFYFWLAIQIPYLHDDWSWGLEVGMQDFLYARQNSRYAGNFFEIIMTRSESLKVLIMGCCSFLIPFLLPRVVAARSKHNTQLYRLFLFVVCNCFILSMNHIMWRETYGWVAGYANFVISCCFLLLWIQELILAAENTSVSGKTSPFSVVIYFILSLCGQLFLENIALICIVFACGLCVFYQIKYKKIPLRILALLVGSILGLIIMFSSDIYISLLKEGTAIDKYRQIPIIHEKSMLKILYRTAVTVVFLVSRLYSLNVFLTSAILLIFLSQLYFGQQERKTKYKKFFFIIDVFLLFLFLFSYICTNILTLYSQLFTVLLSLATVVTFAVIFFQILYLYNGSIRRILLLLWLCGPLVIAPLAVTTETGHRLFVTSNLFLVLFALFALSNLLESFSTSTCRKIQLISGCCLAVMLMYYGLIYTHIGAHKRVQLELIQTAISQKTDSISFPVWPHADYLHSPVPIIPERIQSFKEFYGIPESTDIFFEGK